MKPPITERLAEALRSCVQQLRDQQAMPDDSGYAEYETYIQNASPPRCRMGGHE